MHWSHSILYWLKETFPAYAQYNLRSERHFKLSHTVTKDTKVNFFAHIFLLNRLLNRLLCQTLSLSVALDLVKL